MNRSAWLAVLGLTLLCVLAFAPACGNGFVFWDDNAYFQTNQDFRGFGPAQIGWAWRTKLLDVYQPLGWMLNEAEYVCWKLDPRGYHISSLVLHIANVLLLLLLSVRLVSVRLPDLARQHPTALTACAALVVALFAVHPLRVEAVAWAACQTYLPCITCYLLSLLAYVRYRTASPYRHWLVLAWTLFVAAFLFKAAAVTLPFVVWLLDRLVLPPRPEGRRSVRGERLLFFVPAAVFMAVTVWARDSRVPLAQDGTFTRVAFACASVWFYWLKSALPTDLTNLYYLPEKLQAADVAYTAGIIGFLALAVLLFLWRRRWPMAWAAFLAYVVLVGPSSGLVRSGPQVFADRYSYLPMMAATVAASGGVFVLLTRWPHRRLAVVVPALVGVAVLVLLSRAQCGVWSDSVTLWRHNLAHGGDANPRAHSQLGLSLVALGNDDEALEHFRTAIRLNPGSAQAVHDTGLLIARRGKLYEAEVYFARAAFLDPDRTEYLLDLAAVLVKQNRTGDALPLLTRAERLRPENGDTLVALGHCLGRLGRAAEAVPYLLRAVRLVPANACAHGYLGIALAVQGQDAEGRAELTAAVRLDPNVVVFHYQLGSLLARLGDHDGAAEQFREVRRLDPGHTGARDALRRLEYAPASPAATH